MKTGVAWGWHHGICSDAVGSHPDHLHQSNPSPPVAIAEGSLILLPWWMRQEIGNRWKEVLSW